MLDLYSLIQAEGKEYTIVRVDRQPNATSGNVKRINKIDTLQGVEVPPSYNLKFSKASFVECTTFILLDTFYAEEHSLYPFVEGDYVLIDRTAYKVHDMSTWEGATLLALKRIEGTPPFNVEEVVA